MNAGIVVLKDGTPCICYDDKLPFPIRYVEFSREDYIITLVFDAPGTSKMFGQKGFTFPHPLDPPFASLLEERKNVAVARVTDGQLTEIKVYAVKFKGAAE